MPVDSLDSDPDQFGCAFRWLQVSWTGNTGQSGTVRDERPWICSRTQCSGRPFLRRSVRTHLRGPLPRRGRRNGARGLHRTESGWGRIICHQWSAYVPGIAGDGVRLPPMVGKRPRIAHSQDHLPTMVGKRPWLSQAVQSHTPDLVQHVRESKRPGGCDDVGSRAAKPDRHAVRARGPADRARPASAAGARPIERRRRRWGCGRSVWVRVRGGARRQRSLRKPTR